MRSASADTVKTAAIRRWVGYLAIFGLAFAVIGELDFRLRPRESRLEFQAHNDLYHRLAPGQTGYMWMAQLTQKSPSITINSDGFRGPDVDPHAHEHVVLAVGSSSALGSGVEDDEVWTAELQASLQRDGLDAVVLNGASPGWGPFQHATFIEMNAERVKADALLVLVSAGDLNFLPMANEAQKQRFLEQARLRKKVLDLSPFLAFSVRKAEVLLRRNLAKLTAAWDSLSRRASASDTPKPAASSPEQRRRRLEPHIPYWQRINDYAKRSNTPVVFLVLNPIGEPNSTELVALMRDIAADNSIATVVELDAAKAELTGEGDLKDAFTRRLTIPNDGHPNKRFHTLMGQAASPAIREQLQ